MKKHRLPHPRVAEALILSELTSNDRSYGSPSCAHLFRDAVTLRIALCNNPFSTSLVTQDGPLNIVYSIGVSMNVWIPSEYITLARRHANRPLLD